MTTERSTPKTGTAYPFPNPFVGLRPFKTEESLLFFGRNEQTIELLQRLYETRFLAVVGSSGCGKSSLIRAGLIPKLKAGFLVEDRDRWLTATMKPGDAPLRNLARSLLEAAFDDVTTPMVDEFVKHVGQSGAEYIATRLAPAFADSPSNLLLLIDQFEEIFRFGVESGNAEQRNEAEDFVALMLALAQQQTLPIYVVLTMRSDFIGDCDNFFGLPEAMNRSQYLVPRLTRGQRQQAIEGPIRLFGATISPRLLDRVLNDVGDKSDQLPVMQHALMRTWEQWELENTQSGNSQVDLTHYETTGAIAKTLLLDAEAALNGMTDEELRLTKRMFQTLIYIDRNNRYILQSLHLSELRAVTGARLETIRQVIQHFTSKGRTFLTVSKSREGADPLIKISHESLIRQWIRASEWIKEEAESRKMYMQIAYDADLYLKQGKKDILWKGTRLDLALKWFESNKPNAEWARRYGNRFEEVRKFIEESDSLRKRARRMRQIAVPGCIFLVLIFLLFLSYRDRQRTYMANISIAENEFMAGHYSKSMDLLMLYDTDRANLFFFEKDVRDYRWFDLWKLSHNESATFKGHSAPVRSVVFSPDGKSLASASTDRTIKLWNLQSGQSLATLKGHEDSVWSVVFSPDGKSLASASTDRTIKLWSLQSGQSLATLKGHENFVLCVAFAPDGQALASASYDKTVKLWDFHTGQNLTTLKGHVDSVSAVAFAPDGKTLASASYDKTIKFWDARSGQNLATLKGHVDSVNAVAFAPDGKTLASASYDKTVKLWDIHTGQNLITLKGHESYVYAVAFALNGKTLASASYDKTIKLWDIHTGQNVTTLKGHIDSVNAVAFAPNNKTLASASSDQTVKLWDTASRQNIAVLQGHEDPVLSVAFAPASKTLASAGGDPFGKKDFAIRLWGAATDADVERQRKQ